MKKSLFLLISFILTIVLANIVKADSLEPNTLDSGPSIVVETKLETKSVEKNESTIIATSYNPAIQLAVQEEKAQLTVPVFQVTDYISACDSVNCFTSRDAERGIVQYQSTFYYGHSTIAFNRLKTVYVGDMIKVEDINGVVHTYKIAVRDVKSRAYLNGDGKIDGYTAGVYSANYYGTQYSAAFMTCGNGSNNDSNYRLILFAYEI